VDDRYDEIFFRDVVEEIFSHQDRDKSLACIESYSNYFLRIVGTRGFTGKKAINSQTAFGAMFSQA